MSSSAKISLKFISWKYSPIFLSFWIQKFSNSFMRSGKKKKNEKYLLWNIFWPLKCQTQNQLIFLIYEIFELLRPHIKLLKFQRGKKIHNLPSPVSRHSQYLIAITWIKKFWKPKKKPVPPVVLTTELLNLLTKKPILNNFFISKKNDLQLTAIENLPFAHFRWFQKQKSKFKK